MKTNVYSMNKSRIISIILLGTLLILAACTSPEPEPTAVPEVEAPPEATGTFILGDISDDPIEKIEAFQPLADYLAANLAEFDIGIGEVKIAPDLQTMSEWLESGEVDIYFDSAYPTVVVGETVGAYPILRRWKDGVAEYSTMITVLASSDLNKVDDLQGHSIGFEDPQSTSGYFVPLTYLMDQGQNVVEMQSISSSVDAEDVGYVFAGDENTLDWLVTERVDATVIQSTDFAVLPEESKNELRVLAETGLVPRHLVIVRPGMDSELEAAVKALLMNLDDVAEGSEILLQFEETAQFDEIPADATEILAEIRTLYLQFQEE